MASDLSGHFVFTVALAAGDVVDVGHLNVADFIRGDFGELFFFDELGGGEVGVAGVDVALAIPFAEGFNHVGGEGDGAAVIVAASVAWGVFGGVADEVGVGSECGEKLDFVVVEDFVGSISGAGGVAGNEVSKELAERGNFPEAADPGMPAAVVDLVAEEEAEMFAIDEELVGFGHFPVLDELD